MARWWHAVAIVVGGPLLGVAIAGPPDLAGGDSDIVVSTRPPPARDTTAATDPPASPPPPPHTPSSAAASRAPAQVRVRVYVASTIAGAATNATNKLRAGGYVILEPAWAPKDQPATTRVFFDPGFEREAQAVAAALGVPAQVAPLPSGGDLQLTEEPDVMVLAGNDLAPR